MRRTLVWLIGLALLPGACDKAETAPEEVIFAGCMENPSASSYGCNCLVENVKTDEALKKSLARAINQCKGQGKLVCEQAAKRELGPNGSVQVGVAMKACGIPG
jgi:hypothetical protein